MSFSSHRCRWNLCTFLSVGLMRFGTRFRVLKSQPSKTNASPMSLGRWIALIRASSRRAHYGETLELFHRMRREGHLPDRYLLPTLLRACAGIPDLAAGETLHALAIHSSLCDAFVRSSLIDLYSKCGQIVDARKVFDETLERDVAIWNSMVSGFARLSLVGDAMGMFRNMVISSREFEPDLVTWNSLISGFSQVGDAKMAIYLINSMQIHGFDPDVVSWTAIIGGFVQNFQNEEAFGMFRRMVAVAGVRPSSVTISSLLPACANVADEGRGKALHGYTLLLGVDKDLFVGSSLLDMYAKCGFITDARKVFDDMCEKSPVTWNSMISGYASHGLYKDAIGLLHRMGGEGVKPDHLTFTAVLTACSHAGMVEAGRAMFNYMRGEHRIEPRLEHFACMVDLLGRAGRISEAYEVIEEMPLEPDVFAWGALLGACRNHGNVELAELAASRLSKLDSERAANCPIMLNVFADAGRWEDYERMKKAMKKRRLKRGMGCSWIEGV